MKAWTDSRRQRRSGRSFFGAILLALACESAAPPTGGETHFLRWCGPEGAECGPGLLCLCGVCTRACSEQDACGAFPDAACVPIGSMSACGEEQEPGVCDVPCANDADCAVLSPAHRCESGACRASASLPPREPIPPKPGEQLPSCMGERVAGNEVVILGDSFFAVSHEITAYIEALAREAGALGEGERYRDNSRLLGNALALAGNGIAEQYSAAIAEGDVKVVIMNGGGADVLLGSCEPVSSECPLLVDAAEAGRDLFARMAEDGVEHVVYAFYPDPVDDPPLREKMDALRPLMQAVCAESPVPCHWIDLRPVFEGHYDEYVRPDRKNPTSAGARATAQAIWETMYSRCIAQRTAE